MIRRNIPVSLSVIRLHIFNNCVLSRVLNKHVDVPIAQWLRYHVANPQLKVRIQPLPVFAGHLASGHPAAIYPGVTSSEAKRNTHSLTHSLILFLVAGCPRL